MNWDMLIDTAGSFISSGLGAIFGNKNVKQTNQTNLQIARETNQTNIDLAAAQRAYDLKMWNLQNDYNDPRNQIQRMTDAGINPYIATGSIDSGNASSSAGGQAVPTMVAPTMQANTNLSNDINQIGSSLSNFATATMYDKQLKQADKDLQQRENEIQKGYLDIAQKRLDYGLSSLKAIALQRLTSNGKNGIDLAVERQNMENLTFIDHAEENAESDALGKKSQAMGAEADAMQKRLDYFINEFTNLPVDELAENNPFGKYIQVAKELNGGSLSDDDYMKICSVFGSVLYSKISIARSDTRLRELDADSKDFEYSQNRMRRRQWLSQAGYEYLRQLYPNASHDDIKAMQKMAASGVDVGHGSEFSWTKLLLNSARDIVRNLKDGKTKPEDMLSSLLSNASGVEVSPEEAKVVVDSIKKQLQSGKDSVEDILNTIPKKVADKIVPQWQNKKSIPFGSQLTSSGRFF